MKNNKRRFWSKGDKFDYCGRTYIVKDTDEDIFYQTEFSRIWLKYTSYSKGKHNDQWIDADSVIKANKRG